MMADAAGSLADVMLLLLLLRRNGADEQRARLQHNRFEFVTGVVVLERDLRDVGVAGRSGRFAGVEEVENVFGQADT